MGEIHTRPDFSELYWDSLGTYPKTMPPSGKRQAGYDPGTGNDDGEVPAGDHFNWLLNETFLALNYFALATPRTFEDVWEALAEIAPDAIVAPNRFIVAPGNSGKIWPMGSNVYNTTTTASTGGGVSQVCTYGHQAYYVSGSIGQQIVGNSLEDGSEAWEITSGTGIAGLTCDGLYVYYARLASAGIYTLNRLTGAGVGSGGTQIACAKLASNGVKVGGINPPANPGYAVFFTVAANPTEDGFVDTTSPGLEALAIDRDYLYVAGQRSVTPDKLWAYDLQTRAQYWKTDFMVGSAVDPTIYGIIVTPSYLFVAHQRVDRTGGGDWGSMTSIERHSGTEFSHWDFGQDAINIASDGEFLYITLADFSVRVVQIRDITNVISYTDILGASRSVYACDGVSMIGSNGGSNIRRDWTGQPSRDFQVSDPTDDSRPPWCYNLAIPAK
jgi:hypothetical protein